ncbi:hypothetical protein TUBRATIS_18770 [Tubulinosema ratisbonensis]|uniref:Uncharacterized protein n=1 Tax=Tubulinosema ratisbonensis TaxID=291195 RepID=A0A437AKE1_9MICR|nr:hypothetical protein TUBRATIS_18770 [Tubulinosema ratisbonensis]
MNWLNNKAKLIALLSVINKKFKKRIKLKEGSSLLRQTKKYKNQFYHLINDKSLKKEKIISVKEGGNVYNIDESIVYGVSKDVPYLYIKEICDDEVDRCIFCMNEYDNLKEHLKEEIRKIK